MRVDAHVRSLDVVAKSTHLLDIGAVVDLTVSGWIRERQEVAGNVTGLSPESVSLTTEPLRVTDRIGSGTAVCSVVANRSLPSGVPAYLSGL